MCNAYFIVIVELSSFYKLIKNNNNYNTYFRNFLSAMYDINAELGKLLN